MVGFRYVCGKEILPPGARGDGLQRGEVNPVLAGGLGIADVDGKYLDTPIGGDLGGVDRAHPAGSAYCGRQYDGESLESW